MYSKTSDKQNDIARTGSHSTKPFGTGRVDVLPPSADPWAQIFNDLRSQRDVVQRNLYLAQTALGDTNYKIRMSSDPREQQGLLIKRKALVARLDTLGLQSTELRRDAINAARSSLGQCFLMAARAMLLNEQYDAILASAIDAQTNKDILQFARFPEMRHPIRERSGVEDNHSSVNEVKRASKTAEELAAARARERSREKRKRLAGRFNLQASPPARHHP